MKKITRKQIVNLVYERLNGTIPRLVIDDVLSIIIDKFIDDMVNDKVFSIQNFGTFTPCIIDGFEIKNVITGEPEIIKPFKRIKFVPHNNFKQKIEYRKNFFKKGIY